MSFNRLKLLNHRNVHENFHAKRQNIYAKYYKYLNLFNYHIRKGTDTTNIGWFLPASSLYNLSLEFPSESSLFADAYVLPTYSF